MIKINLATSVITISIKRQNYSIKIQILSVFWMLEEKNTAKLYTIYRKNILTEILIKRKAWHYQTIKTN